MAATKLNFLPKGNGLKRLFQAASIRPAALALFSIVLAYRGGLWLVAIHQFQGGTEANEPPFLLHWLRDSTLMLPLVFASVFISLIVARWLAQRLPPGGSPLATSILIVVMVALITSVVVTAASPLHDIIFQASEAGEHHHSGVGNALSFDDFFEDGMLALAANLIIATLVMLILDGNVWIKARDLDI